MTPSPLDIRARQQQVARVVVARRITNHLQGANLSAEQSQQACCVQTLRGIYLETILVRRSNAQYV